MHTCMYVLDTGIWRCQWDIRWWGRNTKTYRWLWSPYLRASAHDLWLIWVWIMVTVDCQPPSSCVVVCLFIIITCITHAWSELSCWLRFIPHAHGSWDVTHRGAAKCFLAIVGIVNLSSRYGSPLEAFWYSEFQECLQRSGRFYFMVSSSADMQVRYR